MLMRYLGPRRFVFVANPKSASTSVLHSSLADHAQIRLLTGPAGKHMALDDVRNTFGFVFEHYPLEDFLTFGVIREPLDRVVSWFNFRSRPELLDPGNPGHVNYAGDLTFEAFWERDRESQDLRPQSAVLCSVTDPGVSVDVLVRFDHFDQDLQHIARAVGLRRIHVAHRNRSAVVRLRPDDVAPCVRDEIRDFYRADHHLIEQLEETSETGLERYAARVATSDPLPGPFSMHATNVIAQTRGGAVARRVRNRLRRP